MSHASVRYLVSDGHFATPLLHQAKKWLFGRPRACAVVLFGCYGEYYAGDWAIITDMLKGMGVK